MKFKKGRKCQFCWGRGWDYPANGDPVKDREDCMACSGTGLQEQENNEEGIVLGRNE